MAYKINIHDTHRTPYNNATITAMSAVPGSTDPVEFFDFDGNSLGYEVKTNARGFLCDTNGALYTHGVFVGEDAVITVTLGDGNTTSWIVSKDNETTVNDAKLWNADKSIELFSANAGHDKILSYYYLSDRPRINEWGRAEQTVEITAVTDSMSVAKLTTVIHLWSQLDYSDFDDDQVNDPVVQLTLTSTETLPSFGQRISVLNTCSFRVKLMNTDGTFITTVEPFSCRQIAAISSSDGTSVSFRDEDASEGYAAISTIVYNSPTQVLQIDDYTAGIVIIKEDPNVAQDAPRLLNVSQDLSYNRKVVLWWQPTAGSGMMQNLILQSADGFQFAKLRPYSPTMYNFPSGSTLSVNNAPVEFSGEAVDNFGHPDSLNVNLRYVSAGLYTTDTIRWPTGATSMRLGLVGAIAGAADLGTASTVNVQLAVNQNENFEQLLRFEFPNFDDTLGNYLKIRLTIYKVGPDGSTTGTLYIPANGKWCGAEGELTNGMTGGLFKLSGELSAFFKQGL